MLKFFRWPLNVVYLRAVDNVLQGLSCYYIPSSKACYFDGNADIIITYNRRLSISKESNGCSGNIPSSY